MSARKSVAVVGSGISGLGAAWLLSRHHDVVLLEAEKRAGGHSNTVDVPGNHGSVPVDTGFIVYNVAAYPNLIALLDHLGVPTAPTSMSFAVSLGEGRLEYAGTSLLSLLGHGANVARPSHWRMIADIARFFREAPALASAATDETLTLGTYLERAGYSQAFITRHILPMAAAIWSTPSQQVLEFPAAAFIRFFSNHGLLQARNRPQWRTVAGGSREYVRRMLGSMQAHVRLGEPARRIVRDHSGVGIWTSAGEHRFDACVVATHADDALALLADRDEMEQRLLGAFRYASNRAVLHRDSRQMPRRKRLWSSWNYIGHDQGRDQHLSVTYWMNNLQPLGQDCPDTFVTLNPGREIPHALVLGEFAYSHPIFDAAAIAAQRQLWRLQGRRRTWFCGSYFGYGFHEDGLQSGLAAAEDLAGVRRPWTVSNESGRIHLRTDRATLSTVMEAAE